MEKLKKGGKFGIMLGEAAGLDTKTGREFWSNLADRIEIKTIIKIAGREYYKNGKAKLKQSPPIRKMLGAGVPVGAGTDATRVASYNPFVSLYWLVSGKSVGGLQMYDKSNRLDRMEALRLWTVGSSWFSNDSGRKGSIEVGQLADLAVLSKDFFTVAEEEIKSLESVLTIVGGKIVYAKDDYEEYAPPALPVSPSWSPAKTFGGYRSPASPAAMLRAHNHAACGGHGILSNLREKLSAKFDPFGGIGGACACVF